jgi:hypothetical protein
VGLKLNLEFCHALFVSFRFDSLELDFEIPNRAFGLLKSQLRLLFLAHCYSLSAIYFLPNILRLGCVKLIRNAMPELPRASASNLAILPELRGGDFGG